MSRKEVSFCPRRYSRFLASCAKESFFQTCRPMPGWERNKSRLSPELMVFQRLSPLTILSFTVNLAPGRALLIGERVPLSRLSVWSHRAWPRDTLSAESLETVKKVKSVAEGKIPISARFGISRPEHVSSLLRGGGRSYSRKRSGKNGRRSLRRPGRDYGSLEENSLGSKAGVETTALIG